MQGPENSGSLLCGEIGLRINDLLRGSLLHFPALCLGNALLHGGRKVTCGCAPSLVASAIVGPGRGPPLPSAVPFFFLLKSFNYFFCILAAPSVERYIPLPE